MDREKEEERRKGQDTKSGVPSQIILYLCDTIQAGSD